jgi:ABC-type transport system involved in cytochrome bd biosynthesis fused ATPase/permease subunit
MPTDPVVMNKAVSAVHATSSSIAALLLLRYSSWPILLSPRSVSQDAHGTKHHLDDSRNPMINGHNRFANALTAWETAYLLYDTYAMINARRKKDQPTVRAALRAVARDSPVTLAHHVLLSSALLVLQAYIAAGKEKGIWVITAFLLMNSSTPLMHARWWHRQRTGKPNAALDVAFLATFAASRFGVIIWILTKYGHHHGLDPWQAFTLLRKRCQIGTAMLVGLNGVWWTMLAINVAKRNIKPQLH